MKSPFPGMDPYIEECGLFEEFHDDLIGELKRQLARSLPERYVVRSSERRYVVIAESEGKDEYRFKPDIGIVTHAPSVGTAVAEAAPEAKKVSMRAFISEEFRETFIEIYATKPERILVTCIEVLSPSNKRRDSAGWDLYLRKRQALLLGEANLVEIDLLRKGDRFPMLDPWPASPYAFLVCRRTRAPYCDVWPASYSEPLPTLHVPLLRATRTCKSICSLCLKPCTLNSTTTATSTTPASSRRR